MINEGNKASGGITKICSAYGIFGFIKFVSGYYLILITQRKEVGCLAGHIIYTIKSTEMIPIKPKEDTNGNSLQLIWKKINKKLSQTANELAESRYLSLFQFLDISKDFFFSYTYDLTNSFQCNYMHIKNKLSSPKYQDRYEWNYFQMKGNNI